MKKYTQEWLHGVDRKWNNGTNKILKKVRRAEK